MVILNQIGNIKKIKDLPVNFYKFKLKNFKTKVQLYLETENYIVKTIDSKKELLEATKLRFEVFLSYRKKLVSIDFDDYDLLADHLILIDKKSKKLVGTYRLISSNFSDKFYSESEFYIDRIKNLNNNLLEIGRAAIKKDFRNGITISLLWKGIASYAKKVGAQYIFGCSSIYTTNSIEAAYLFLYFQKNYFREDLLCEVKEKYKIVDFEKNLNFLSNIKVDLNYAENLIPSLLKSYLKAGSFICSYPALDKEFGCIDFITILDTNNLSQSFNKYKK